MTETDRRREEHRDLMHKAAEQGAPARVKVGEAKGRPMLNWVGKHPLRELPVFPAQEVERFGVEGTTAGRDWSDWPTAYPQGGLLLHGDNREVLAHLISNGFRGKIDLVYIDPPFDSGADYVRRVSLRGPKGTVKLDGEGYTLGEQIQYTDIWANDTYLQFVYERLLLLKELLAPNSSIVLHTDYHKTHLLRCLMDEVFGAEAFVNELVWHYPDNFQGNVKGFASNHDLLLWYGLGAYYWSKPQRELEKTVRRPTRVWDKKTATLMLNRDEHGRPMYKDYTHASFDDVIEIPQRSVVVPGNADYTGYPTAKPPALLSLLVDSLAPPHGIVLDCFVGSGTTAAVAQKLGRRWIACDINKGAIQTTSKRLLEVIHEQATDGARQIDLDGSGGPDAEVLAFTTYRVNDYDLAIQHNEAVGLACDALGVQHLPTDIYFDGTLGRQLVKILPFDHPASPLDIDAVVAELRNRPAEDRDVTVVALGKEATCDERLAEYNRRGAPNKITLVELRSDPKYGKFFAHQAASAEAHLERSGTTLRLVIDEVISPTIIERLTAQEGVVAPRVTDWRMVVDSVLIDPMFDGQVFRIGVADVPVKKADFVVGTYDLPTGAGPVVALKITDMLGEEILVTLDATSLADQ